MYTVFGPPSEGIACVGRGSDGGRGAFFVTIGSSDASACFWIGIDGDVIIGDRCDGFFGEPKLILDR